MFSTICFKKLQDQRNMLNFPFDKSIQTRANKPHAFKWLTFIWQIGSIQMNILSFDGKMSMKVRVLNKLFENKLHKPFKFYHSYDLRLLHSSIFYVKQKQKEKSSSHSFYFMHSCFTSKKHFQIYFMNMKTFCTAAARRSFNWIRE